MEIDATVKLPDERPVTVPSGLMAFQLMVLPESSVAACKSDKLAPLPVEGIPPEK